MPQLTADEAERLDLSGLTCDRLLVLAERCCEEISRRSLDAYEEPRAALMDEINRMAILGSMCRHAVGAEATAQLMCADQVMAALTQLPMARLRMRRRRRWLRR